MLRPVHCSCSALLAAMALALAPLAPAEDETEPDLEVPSLANPAIARFPLVEAGIDGKLHDIGQLPHGAMAVLFEGGMQLYDGAFWSRQEHVSWANALATLPNGRSLVACSQGIVELAPDARGAYEAIRRTSSATMGDLNALISVAYLRGALFGLEGMHLLEIDRWGSAQRHKLPNWSNGIFALGDELYFLGGSATGIGRWDFSTQQVVELPSVIETAELGWPQRSAPRAEGGVWMLLETGHIIGFDGERSWIWSGSETLARKGIVPLSVVELEPGQLAVGGAEQGLLLFDADGREERQLSIARDAATAPVTHLAKEFSGALWAAIPGELVRIAFDPSASAFAKPKAANAVDASAPAEAATATDSIASDIRTRLARWALPRMETFYPLQTGVQGELRSLATLPQGELAVLTEFGLFIFDGARWYRQPDVDGPFRLLNRPDDASALLACAQGIVELAPDPAGGYRVDRLTTAKVMSGIHELTHVALAGDSVYGLRGDQLIEIGPDGAAHRHQLPNWATGIFAIGDSLYFTGGGHGGINRWDSERKAVIDLGELTKPVDYAWPLMSAPRAEGGVWILVDSNRVLGFDGETVWLWPGSETLAARSPVKDLRETGPGQLAFATAAHGLLFFDQNGGLEREISRAQGLDDISVGSIGLDSQGGLWAATKAALSRLSLDLTTLILDGRHGLTETVTSMAFFRNRLYLGTDSGLFVSADNPKEAAEVFTLLDPNRSIGDLLVHDDHLFIAGGQLKVLDSTGRLETLAVDGGTFLLQPSRFPDLLLFANYKGVHALRKSDGHWRLRESLPGATVEIFSLAESADGLIWGGTGGSDIARIELDADGFGSIKLQPLPGSTAGIWSIVASIEGQVYANTTPSARWDVALQTWVAAPEMIYAIGEAPHGFAHVIGRSPDEAYITLKQQGGATMKRPHLGLVGLIASQGRASNSRATSLLVDEQQVAWIGGPFGLLRAVDPWGEAPDFASPPRIHRLVSLKDNLALPIPQPGEPLTLEPRQTSLRIHVDWPLFESSQHHRYQIYVEGLDQDWPEFIRSPFRELTNLDPGRYVLHVNTRDISGRVASAAAIPVTLKPMWYQQPWTYGAYALLASGLVLSIVRRSTRAHTRRAIQLQTLVTERTQEIEAKNVELERQAQTLEQKNAELEEKTDELVATTESLTQTLQQLQEAQQQLVATARTAGKAEVAINVLHNVGNVLNSINISLATVSQRVSTTNVPKLARLAQLVEEKQQDIVAFLTTDPRGQRVPEYLVKLARALSEESASIAREIAAMETEVEHIKRIIAAQQTHAKSYSLVEDLDVRELFETAFTILASNPVSSRCECVNDLPHDLIVRSDKHRLLEIILNLIANAQDAVQAHAPERGRIIAAAENGSDGQYVTLTVRDNGIGMDATVAKRIFTHGFTTKSDGHGFGLHSAANAARRLGGELSLSSDGPGLGATARLTLPLHPPSTPRASSPQSDGASQLSLPPRP